MADDPTRRISDDRDRQRDADLTTLQVQRQHSEASLTEVTAQVSTLGERYHQIAMELEKLRGAVTEVDKDVQLVDADLKRLHALLTTGFVTAAEFGPIKSGIYKLVGAVLLAIAMAILGLVLRGGGVK